MKNRLANFSPGLRLEKPTTLRLMARPKKWTPPEYVDGRPLLLPADDQGQTSACTGFGMAGVCEALRWWATGERKSFDGLALYDWEKKLDNDNQEGSTLETAIKAAHDLGWLTFTNPEGKTVTVDVYDITNPVELQYALHRCPVVLGGFRITQAWSKPSKDGSLANSRTFIGGHCVDIDAFDPFGIDICNSWGLAYGVKGHIRLSWAQVKQQLFSAKGFLLRVA